MRTLVSVVVVLVLSAAAAAAQETRGKILGTVQDANGVVPGTVLDTQVSANRFYTLDKQHVLTQYKPSDYGLALSARRAVGKR